MSYLKTNIHKRTKAYRYKGSYNTRRNPGYRKSAHLPGQVLQLEKEV
jgi:hypothetical protein